MKGLFCVFMVIFNFSILPKLMAEEEKLTITSYYPSPKGSYIELSTTGNTYLAVTSGNLGIGTSNPQGKLQVGSTPYLQVSSAGDVGIGIAASSTYKLYVDGTLFVNGDMEAKVEYPVNNRENVAAESGRLKVIKYDEGPQGQCIINVIKGIIRFTTCGS